MNMELLVVTGIIMTVFKIILADETKIIEYFDSDTFTSIQNHWRAERKSFENALVLILQQDYGHGGMNVYVRRMADSYKISDGFYFSDNIVDLILLETRLQDTPIMIAPEVTFALASNYLHVEAELEKLILKTNYLLIRNQSDVVFAASEQDTNKKSPFSFQQVQDSGELTIIAEYCHLAGYAISSFGGETVNLGLDTFRVTNCKFSIEIYSAGLGSPPVFGSYFSEKQSTILEMMLTNPIRHELMPKLQAAVFTYVNISAMFGDKLPQLRFHQNSIFKETSNYMSGVVGKFVQNTIKKTQGILKMKPLDFSWNKKCLDGACGSHVRLSDVILYGLDTAYSAHIGGPVKLQFPTVAEAIRFSTMQVRGKIQFQNTTVKGQHEFAVELRDVAVNIEMEAKSSSFALVPSKVYVTGWRSFEFSILELHMLGHERRASQSFIMGYLVNEIPKVLLDHISQTLGNINNKVKQNRDKAVDETLSEEVNENQKEENDSGTKENSNQVDPTENENETLFAGEKDRVVDASFSEEANKKQTGENDRNSEQTDFGKHEENNEKLLAIRDSDNTDEEALYKEGNNNLKKENDKETETNSNHSDSTELDHKKSSIIGQNSDEEENESVDQNLSHPSDNEIR